MLKICPEYIPPQNSYFLEVYVAQYPSPSSHTPIYSAWFSFFALLTSPSSSTIRDVAYRANSLLSSRRPVCMSNLFCFGSRVSNPRDAHAGCPIFPNFVIVGEKYHSEPTPIRGPLLEICRNIIGLERIPTLKPPPWRSSYLGGPTGSDIVNT